MAHSFAGRGNSNMEEKMGYDTGYFPLFVDLRGKKILIAGAGKIAARRATALVEFGADVTVVAPSAMQQPDFAGSLDFSLAQDKEIADGQTECNELPEKQDERGNTPWECRSIPIQELAGAGRLVWKCRVFEEKDLDQAFLVIAATNDPVTNDKIVQLCRRRGIPVNHAGDQSQCDFQFPAIVRNDLVVIGINAGGKNHGLVKRVAAGLREWITTHL